MCGYFLVHGSTRLVAVAMRKIFDRVDVNVSLKSPPMIISYSLAWCILICAMRSLVKDVRGCVLVLPCLSSWSRC